MILSRLIVLVPLQKFILFNTVSRKNIELVENYFLIMLKFRGDLAFHIFMSKNSAIVYVSY